MCAGPCSRGGGAYSPRGWPPRPGPCRAGRGRDRRSRAVTPAAMDRRLLELQRRQARRSLELAELQRTDAEREPSARSLAASGALTPQTCRRQARCRGGPGPACPGRGRPGAPRRAALPHAHHRPVRWRGDRHLHRAGRAYSAWLISAEPPRRVAGLPRHPDGSADSGRDPGKVAVGMATRVVAEAYPEREFEGSIVAADAAAEPGSRASAPSWRSPTPTGSCVPACSSGR